MATKAELEVQVGELQAKLGEQKPGGAVDTELLRENRQLKKRLARALGQPVEEKQHGPDGR